MQRQEKGSRLLLEVDLRYVTNQMRPLIRDEINVILQTSLIHRNTLAFIKNNACHDDDDEFFKFNDAVKFYRL